MYKNYNLHIAYPMLYQYCCYWDCLDGWHDILFDLTESLEEHLIEHSLDTHFALGVEEKSGELIFSMLNTDYAIDNYIQESSELCADTCEICGEEGAIKTLNDVVMIRCNECYEKENGS